MKLARKLIVVIAVIAVVISFIACIRGNADLFKKIMLIILCISGGVLGITLICSPLYLIFGLLKFFYHGILKWHQPDDSPKRFDGLTVHAKCKYCGKDIMQDSQGNWF